MTPRTIEPRRVAVTGMSVATALGFELETFWSAILADESGIRRMDFASELDLPVRIGGCVDRAGLKEAAARYQLKDKDDWHLMGLYVVGRALEHAGFATDRSAPIEADVIVGTGHGNIVATNEGMAAFQETGPRRVRPTAVLRSMSHRIASLASIQFGLTGASHVVSCACASASVAIGQAFQQVRFGMADRAVAASADSGFDPATFSAWNRLGVLSPIEDPAKASRPFDAAREGLVMGEGAAALVLEAWDVAEARGATILGEILGYGASSDASHLLQPKAEGQVVAIQRALRDAGLQASDLGYVNAHGTGTELADVVEAESIQLALGDAGRTVPVSNTKAQLGHLMGATAGVELITTLLALRDGKLPPSRNLDDPDPRCPLNFVRDEPLSSDARYALKNSFAFGGSNSVVVVGRG